MIYGARFDAYALLNYTYLEWRSQNYSGDFPYDPSLIDELNDISGSSIMYGASKSYTGDRSTLNQDYGEELLPLSVPWLLDNYGYIDMAMYPEVPYNEQAFGGNIETSQGTQTELHLLDNLLAYAEKYDIELFRFEEEQNLAQWLETLDQELAYVQEDNIFGAPRYKRTVDRSHYVYCGELQENQPNGYGILFGPTDENDGIMSYNEWSYDMLKMWRHKKRAGNRCLQHLQQRHLYRVRFGRKTRYVILGLNANAMLIRFRPIEAIGARCTGQ